MTFVCILRGSGEEQVIQKHIIRLVGAIVYHFLIIRYSNLWSFLFKITLDNTPNVNFTDILIIVTILGTNVLYIVL